MNAVWLRLSPAVCMTEDMTILCADSRRVHMYRVNMLRKQPYAGPAFAVQHAAVLQ